MLTTMKKQLLTLAIIAGSTLLTGCDLSDNDNSNNNPVDPKPSTPLIPLEPSKPVEPSIGPSSSAVVQGLSPDYNGSKVFFLDTETEQATAYYNKTGSDYTLATNKGDVYHIGRSGIDRIDKYAASDYYNAEWSYSTQDKNDSLSRNPYNLVFASDTKAYLIRYDSPKVWIVNPTAMEKENFKIGEIDLSAYNPKNNTVKPTPAAAVISQGKLFIAMQRLSESWAPNPAYIAVFDTSTDTEIETNSDPDDNLKGILLKGLNPLENSMVKGPEGKVYVTSHDGYVNPALTNSRIEEIDPSSYALRTVLTAADIENNEKEFINASVILSADKGYFYSGKVVFTPTYGEVSTLYEFNPTTGKITASEVADTGAEHINYLNLDKNGFLWLSMINPSTAGIDIINSKTNKKEGGRILTGLNPYTIRFLDK